MAKRYESVLDLVKDISDNKKFHSELRDEIESKSLAKTLFAIRCSKGIKQEQMAKRLDCSQGKISKLENSTIESIKVSDLVAYAKAMKLHLTICFHDRLTATQLIKFHVFEIKRHLDHLAKLAHKDKGIDQGIRGFISETLFNFLSMVKKSAALLPKQSKVEKYPVLEVCSPKDMEQEEAFDNQEELIEA